MQPIGFFVHHQGRGHAARCRAIIEALGDRPVDVLTADPALMEGCGADLIGLPQHIGAAPAAPGLHAHPTPPEMHCAPLGVALLRQLTARVTRWFEQRNPALFVVDVSAELTLLARLCSVPAVKIRMHGRRGDPGHMAAYRAAVGMLAPFDARLEQPDYPDWARQKTHYCGGLAVSGPVPARGEARRRLGIAEDRHVVLIVSGGGGVGAPWAPLTMAARALPDTLWFAAGPVRREGHETEFPNLVHLGWVEGLSDWIAAVDVVIGAPGDSVTHEVARIGRPFVAAPEWRYFDEQRLKADRLEALGAALKMDPWPGDFDAWRAVIDRAHQLDPAILAELQDDGAAGRAAAWLEETVASLWSGAAPAVRAAE